jgi:hypothetical protein
MMTRHGRSRNTVSRVRLKPLLVRDIGITIAPARMALASSTILRAVCPARTFSQWPLTRRPPCTFASSIVDSAAASCSGRAASIGLLAGTEMVTRTWIPRRRRAAIRVAVAITSGT